MRIILMDGCKNTPKEIFNKIREGELLDGGKSWRRTSNEWYRAQIHPIEHEKTPEIFKYWSEYVQEHGPVDCLVYADGRIEYAPEGTTRKPRKSRKPKNEDSSIKEEMPKGEEENSSVKEEEEPKNEEPKNEEESKNEDSSVKNEEPKNEEEKPHKDWDEMLAYCEAGEDIFLVGDAGTGKSYLARILAEKTSRPFFGMPSIVDETQLLGYNDAMGRYVPTNFYKAFTEGGLLLLDEMDASSEVAILAINDALASRECTFPCGQVKAHPRFVCVATGNTVGKGSDSTYTGRTRLDASTLDRFWLFETDYNPEIENKIAGSIELADFVRAFRRSVRKNGIDCLATYRSIKRLALAEKKGLPLDKAIRQGLVKYLAIDELATITCDMKHDSDYNANNKWFKALKKC